MPAAQTLGMRAVGASERRRRWALVALAVLLLGLLVSVTGALLWRTNVQHSEKQAFRTSATDVTETLEMQLGRDSEFVATLRGVLTMQPHLSATAFRKWFSQVEGEQPQIGRLGTLVVVPVPARGLGAFQTGRNADPAFIELIGGHISPVSDSGRAGYCLLSAGVVRSAYSVAIDKLLQGDWCNPAAPIGGYPTGGATQAKLMRTLAASGQMLVYPVKEEGVSNFFLETAFYRRDTPLLTIAQRSRAVRGWVSSSFDTPSLIDSAVGEHRRMAVALYHANPGDRWEEMGHASTDRRAKPLTYSNELPINGRWLVRVRGAGVASGMSAGLQAWIVFAAGALSSVLLFVLILVLSRSRARALGMVEQKTGQLRHQALHDALTGLPNRVLALDRAEQMLARARRRQVPVAALYIGIDGFKHVNDTFGHAAGDEILRIIASRLASVVREGDTAARLSGDEFVVLVEGSTLDAGPELVAERLLDVLRQPYDLNGNIGRRLSVTVSIGIAVGLREDADSLLADADVALYQAKSAGKNRSVIFHSSMHAAARDRLTIEMDLSEALEHNQLFLLYQPTFDLQSERVIGVEALVRWRHPTRGVVAPDDFIPVAEESGQIVAIGRWVLTEACRQAVRWREHGHHVGMAVNVSGRQLDDDSLLEDVGEAISQSGIEPGSLTLEVTETTLMRDPNATAERLRRLKGLGVRIAIDDFGTGYSSLAYLRQFPADALKIDRSFVGDIAGSKQSTALIHTLVQLGKSLHLETLAEGIEDRTQLATLQREHCDQGQGFLFSRPLGTLEIEKFLEQAQPKAHCVPSA
ncbi:MAG: putative bifunctional diguanylate cyclase/phosphodiesterase [Solirubrobacteraceae bacterium]